MRFRRAIACGVVGFAVVWPFGAAGGWCDTWPAWALYASRPERARIYVAESDRERLPESIREHVGEPDWFGWCRIRVDRWSLATVGAPEYPQNRVRVGIAMALAERFDLGDGIRVVLESRAERWTGEREERTLEGTCVLERHARTFLLNGLPNDRFACETADDIGG